MTNKQLIKLLQLFPENLEVVLRQTETEFPNVPVESVKLARIEWSEDPLGKVLAKERCIVITDEI